MGDRVDGRARRHSWRYSILPLPTSHCRISRAISAPAPMRVAGCDKYLISNAIVLPMGAWTSSVVGRKRFFMLQIRYASPWRASCAVLRPHSLSGCGPVSFRESVVGACSRWRRRLWPDLSNEKRGQAFPFMARRRSGAIDWPSLGGWITDNYSWRWIFYLNIPVGFLALTLVEPLRRRPAMDQGGSHELEAARLRGLRIPDDRHGGMQIMLDKGEENAWFASEFIRLSPLSSRSAWSA